MDQLEKLARSALAGDGLQTRSLTQDFFREQPILIDIAKPEIGDEQVLAIIAALLELFASRMGQQAPAWTTEIGPVAEPIFLIKAARTMKRLRHLCETEAPEPLKKRRVYAPPNYLEFV
ncbi:MAG: hypothetical protein AAF485_32180 [Chloroflexota bacterium]